MTDPYQVLGVPRHADPDEIKRAFRRQARRVHPDSDAGNPSADENFKRLAAAYQLLSDPARRARYDRGETVDGFGHARRETSRPNGDRPRSENRHRRRSDRAGFGTGIDGTDVAYALTISFREAARGAVRHLASATGKRLSVKVPPGAVDGQVLRLKGEGMGGLGGGAAGDALIEVRVTPDPQFERTGEDIRVELPVTLAEAVLGGRVETPTIDGAALVTIPSGSNSGTVLRLRGKGIGRADGSCGDQYVRLTVVLPDIPDTDLVRFVTRWSEKHPYRVRRL
ncbi:MAG: DnaJ C-terminal domain-containing protein [Rhodospirillales bacterium]